MHFNSAYTVTADYWTETCRILNPAEAILGIIILVRTR